MWSRMVTMNQFTVRSIGIGVAAMALLQLPVLASNRALTTSGSQSSSQTDVRVMPSAIVNPSEPQLLAASLNSRSLRQGDEGTDVRLLQRYLSRIGLYPYVIDGLYGQETANAVIRYQRSRDLPATGIADESTLIDMNFDFLDSRPPVRSSAPVRSAPAVAAAPTAIRSGQLGFGSTGDDVVALQRRLNDFGIPVFVDGDYGFETEQGVRTYQRIQGLNVTGTADGTTLARMGFSASENRYVAAVIASESELDNVRVFFADAYMDRARGGRFINIGNFGDRFPAEARVDAAAARGFNTRVIYRRSGLFR